jgi:hypothetical protein
MRKSYFIAVGLLASAGASAATHDLYIGGASAQSAFWKADFTTTVCGGVAPSTYVISNSGAGGVPSNEAWRCTAAGGSLPAGVIAGDTVTVHYNSELGSISGVAPLVYDNAIAPRLFVNPDSADCSGVVCAITSYDNKTETFTSGNGTALVPKPTSGTFHQFDIGVADVEIKHWAFTNNWTDATFSTAMGTQPSTAQMATAAAGGTVMNGQVFSVIANNTGPMAGISSISQQSLRGIFTGQYDVWGDVPEVGAGNATPIILCRREYGSGTGVSSSIFLTGAECGRSPTLIASIVAPNNMPAANIVENVSTGTVRTCVQNNSGGIGIASLSISANYKTLDIDNIQANAHNAANGFYPFTMESWVYNKSAVSGASSAMAALAGSLITNARRAANLTSQIEGTAVLGANGQYTATTRRSNFALPIGGTGNTPPTVAKGASTTVAVIGTSTKGGDNCKLPSFNSNTL